MSGGVLIPNRAWKWIAVSFTVSLFLLVAASVAVALSTQRGIELASRGALRVSLITVFAGYGAFLAATVAHYFARRDNSPQFAIANIVILAFVILLLFFAFRSYLSVRWLALAIVFVAFVQTATFASARHRRATLARVMKREDGTALQGFERQFRGHSHAYAAIPVGTVAGALYGILRALPPRDTLRSIVLACTILVLACVVYFLVRGANRMANAIAKVDEAAPQLDVRVGKSIEVVVSPAVDAEGRRQLLDSACIAADIRKLMLYNQYQQLAVAIAMGTVAAYAITGAIHFAIITVVFVATAIVLVQVPYVVGQQRAHSAVLSDRRGVEREELREQLSKYCPLFPKGESFVALTVSGTAGTAMYKALEKLVTDTILG
jgi:hypothetical protein